MLTGAREKSRLLLELRPRELAVSPHLLEPGNASNDLEAVVSQTTSSSRNGGAVNNCS